MREPPELDKALLQGDLGDGGLIGRTILQRGMNGAESLVTQKRHGSDAEGVMKGAVQPAPRHAKGGAKFRHMHRARTGSGEIILDIVHEPQRRWQRATLVR